MFQTLKQQLVFQSSVREYIYLFQKNLEEQIPDSIFLICHQDILYIKYKIMKQ